MKYSKEILALQEARGDPAESALVVVDFAYPSLTKAASSVIKESLKAAAIPHWFDVSILGTLLDITQSESSRQLAILQKLSLVEPFVARGDNTLNVHEASRLALRKRLADEDELNFHIYSTRAVSYFSGETNPAAQIERIYHLLCSDPIAGAREIEILTVDEFDKTPPEERYAFAEAFRELDNARLIDGSAKVWVTIYIASVHEMRSETPQQLEMAHRAIVLSRDNSDARAEGVSQCLVGKALQKQGKLHEAQSAFQMFFDISSQLVAQDSDNKSWKRDIVVAQNKLEEIGKEVDSDKLLVYLICTEMDRKATIPIRKYFRNLGAEVSMPAFMGDASEIRSINQHLLSTSDLILIYYGAGDKAWERSIEAQIKKSQGYRKHLTPITCYTYLAHPLTDDKEDLIDMEEPDIINGINGVSEADLQEWLLAIFPERAAVPISTTTSHSVNTRG